MFTQSLKIKGLCALEKLPLKIAILIIIIFVIVVIYVFYFSMQHAIHITSRTDDARNNAAKTLYGLIFLILAVWLSEIENLPYLSFM